MCMLHVCCEATTTQLSVMLLPITPGGWSQVRTRPPLPVYHHQDQDLFEERASEEMVAIQCMCTVIIHHHM